MEKLAKRPHHFEYAVMKTLSKVNEVGSCMNVVTIGPEHSSVISDTIPFNESNERDVSRNVVLVNRNNKEMDEEDFSKYAIKALHDMENLRKISVNDGISEHIFKLKKIEESLDHRMNENLKLAKEDMIIKNKLRPKKIESSICNEDLVISHKMFELMKRYSDNLKHEQEVIKENFEANELKLASQNERIRKLCAVDKSYRAIYEEIVDNTMLCKNPSKLSLLIDIDYKKIEQFSSVLGNIIEKAKLNDIEDSDIETSESLLRNISSINSILKDYIDRINAEEDQIASTERKLCKSDENLCSIQPEEIIKERNEPQPVKIANLDKCVCKECLDLYIILNENLNEFNKGVESFISQVNSTKFLRKLKIAISTPVNALSSVSATHMKDKFFKISQFLIGNFSSLNTTFPNLPRESYFVFVVDYLCRQFINHAEKRFMPSKSEEAFVLASLIVALWVEFPNFGTVFLANIMRECPYTIPAYWPRETGQTEQEYYISLGYQYRNDEIEEELSFLNRMAGIFMLYIAITVTNAPKNRPHPHGLENGWKWVASTLNLEPRANITPTLLHIFLEMSGFKLSHYYGMQFWKVVHLLNTEYCFKVEKVTSVDLKAPVSRLKIYLQTVLRSGFKEPKGILNVDNWQQ